ncbi:hypothetical protein BDQ17DRAFT_1359971 [Cyathus striatus]|nr:hypothetical protein BDQ17DRAFT_1359971 [Cyathus striatus]
MGSPMVEAFLKSRLERDCIEHIKGNASDEIKEIPVKWLALRVDVAHRLRVAEVWVLPSPDDPVKLEAKVCVEVNVTPGTLHDGCVLFLLDEVTAITAAAINAAEGRISYPGVSNTINAMFHAPASVLGSDSNTARVEIFDSDHRLVASGAQLLMQPSKPSKAKM